MTYNPRLPAKVIPALVLVAILGYLAGGGMSRAGHASVSLTQAPQPAASANAVVLEYPTGYHWVPSSGAPEFAGLAINHPLVLAPVGRVSDAGLIVGETRGEVLSPLPRQFLLRVSNELRGEVVNLLSTQAYRYSHLTAGSAHRLTIYAIPNAGGTTTALLCYASQTGNTSSYLSECEQIVPQLTLQVEAQSRAVLTPEATYAHQIAMAIGRVDQVRSSLRSTMSAGAHATALARQAKRLSQALSEAAQSVSTLQPPTPAAARNSALAAALAHTHDAYSALATAAAELSPTAYQAARSRVYAAETAIDTSLQGFAQLGYG